VTVEAEPVETIPLSHLALDLPAPIGGWVASLTARGIDVVTDDIGRLAITRDDARTLFAERAEAEAKRAEQAARVAARHERHVPRGNPPIHPDATALETMLAADPKPKSVYEQLFDDQLAGRPDSGRRFRIDPDKEES
jgi:hypothetical protein